MADKSLNKAGVSYLWGKIKTYVNANRFDATYLQINPQTGHLEARQDSNIKFSIGANGHIMSEVT